ELFCAAKSHQRLSRHGVDEIAQFDVLADPAVEAVVLPQEKRARTRPKPLGRIFQQAIDDVGAEAVSANPGAVDIPQLPLGVGGVIAPKRLRSRKLASQRPEMARIGGGYGDLQDAL